LKLIMWVTGGDDYKSRTLTDTGSRPIVFWCNIPTTSLRQVRKIVESK